MTHAEIKADIRLQSFTDHGLRISDITIEDRETGQGVEAHIHFAETVSATRKTALFDDLVRTHGNTDAGFPVVSSLTGAKPEGDSDRMSLVIL